MPVRRLQIQYSLSRKSCLKPLVPSEGVVGKPRLRAFQPSFNNPFREVWDFWTFLNNPFRGYGAMFKTHVGCCLKGFGASIETTSTRNSLPVGMAAEQPPKGPLAQSPQAPEAHKAHYPTCPLSQPQRGLWPSNSQEPFSPR